MSVRTDRRKIPGWTEEGWAGFVKGIDRLVEHARFDEREVMHDLRSLVLPAVDPHLSEVVELAARPFELDDDPPASRRLLDGLPPYARVSRQMTASGRPTRRLRVSIPQTSYTGTLHLPVRVLADVREHAESVDHPWEIVGSLFLDEDDRVVEYRRARNAATEPRRGLHASSWKPMPGLRSILLHSHPRPFDATPSLADVEYHRARRAQGFAIYSLGRHRVAVWALDEGDELREVPVVVEAA